MDYISTSSERWWSIIIIVTTTTAASLARLALVVFGRTVVKFELRQIFRLDESFVRVVYTRSSNNGVVVPIGRNRHFRRSVVARRSFIGYIDISQRFQRSVTKFRDLVDAISLAS
jgi:hypothetical protein